MCFVPFAGTARAVRGRIFGALYRSACKKYRVLFCCMEKRSLGNGWIWSRNGTVLLEPVLDFCREADVACVLMSVCWAQQLPAHQELKFTSGCTVIALKLLVIKSKPFQ